MSNETTLTVSIQVQQMIDLVLTCKRNAENEVNREEAGRSGAAPTPGRKRRLEQVKAERAIKYLRASQDCGKNSHVPGETSSHPVLRCSAPGASAERPQSVCSVVAVKRGR